MNPNQNPNLFVPKKVIENYSYQLNDFIGTGCSSQVFQGRDERTGDVVAVKVIDMKSLKNEVQKFLLKNEIAVMNKLNNVNCLKMYDVFQTQNNTYIITEFCGQGDLKQLIAKHGHLTEQAAVKILKHVVNGLKELINHKIIHRDIKPANIFIKDGIPKLADFGFSKDMEGEQCKFYYNVGSPIYMSPQALKHNQYSFKSDIWSIGVTFFEMLYGTTPWDAGSEKELAEKIVRIPVQFPTHIQVSENSKDFIRLCLHLDENVRLGVTNIDQHPIFFQTFQNIKDKIPRNMVDEKENRKIMPAQAQSKTPVIDNQIKQVVDYSQPLFTHGIKTMNNQNEVLINKVENNQVSCTNYQMDKSSDKNVMIQMLNNELQKTTPNRKTKDNVQQHHNIEEQHQVNSEIQYSNDQIVLAQINYCRYLVRLAKLTEDFSIIQTPLLTEKVLYLIYKNVMCKITKLQEMCQSQKNIFILEDFENYIKNPNFKKFSIVINEYYMKYTKLYDEKWTSIFSPVQGQLRKDNKLCSVFEYKPPQEDTTFYYVVQHFLKNVINDLNQTLKDKLKDQPDNLGSQLEGSIVLLDYIVTFFQLTQLILDNISDFLYFSQTSKIEQIAEGRPVKLTKQHFQQIRNKITSLEIDE